MTVNFLAPARPGPITGEATVTQLGKTIAFVEGRLMTGDDTVLATATTSVRLVEVAKAIKVAGNQKVVIARSEAAKQSTLSLRPMDCFARNDISSSLRAARPEAARSAVLR
jgi:Thioesterase superfamily